MLTVGSGKAGDRHDGCHAHFHAGAVVGVALRGVAASHHARIPCCHSHTGMAVLLGLMVGHGMGACPAARHRLVVGHLLGHAVIHPAAVVRAVVRAGIHGVAFGTSGGKYHSHSHGLLLLLGDQPGPKAGPAASAEDAERLGSAARAGVGAEGGNLSKDGGHSRVQVVAGLLGIASGKAASELLGFKAGNAALGIAQLFLQPFAVKVGNQGAGSFAFRMDSGAGVAALTLQIAIGFAAAAVDAALGLAAAGINGRFQGKGVLQALHFGSVGRAKGGNGVVLGGDLALQARGQHSGFRAGLALGNLCAKAGDGGIDAAEALTHGVLGSRALQHGIAPDAGCVAAEAGKAVHEIQPGQAVTVVATAVVIAAAVVTIAEQAAAHSTADSTADERTAPATPTVTAVVAGYVKSGHQPGHFCHKKNLQGLCPGGMPGALEAAWQG